MDTNTLTTPNTPLTQKSVSVKVLLIVLVALLALGALGYSGYAIYTKLNTHKSAAKASSSAPLASVTGPQGVKVIGRGGTTGVVVFQSFAQGGTPAERAVVTGEVNTAVAAFYGQYLAGLDPWEMDKRFPQLTRLITHKVETTTYTNTKVKLAPTIRASVVVDHLTIRLGKKEHVTQP